MNIVYSPLLAGGGKVYAYIKVTYPAGSICTCSNGTKTLTAKDTGGECIFYIPEAGTWTVSCTDGTSSAESAPISVTTQNQIDSIILSYNLVLYSAGTEYVGFENKRYTAQSLVGTYANNGNYYTLGAANADTSICRSITNKIDLTPFSRLEATCQKRGELTNFGRLSVYTADRPEQHLEAFTEIGSTKQIYSVDISNVTGEYYICVGVATNASINQTWVDVYDILLKADG